MKKELVSTSKNQYNLKSIDNRMLYEMNCVILKGLEQGVIKEFKTQHLSENLMNTIQVYRPTMSYGNQNIEINGVFHIPAVVYDIDKYMKEKVITYLPQEGSYAIKLHKEGFVRKTTYKNVIQGGIIESSNTNIGMRNRYIASDTLRYGQWTRKQVVSTRHIGYLDRVIYSACEYFNNYYSMRKGATINNSKFINSINMKIYGWK